MIKGVLWEENEVLHKQIVGEVHLGAICQIYTIGCKQELHSSRLFYWKWTIQKDFQWLGDWGCEYIIVIGNADIQEMQDSVCIGLKTKM